MKSPRTNGICECFHQTGLQEFYQVAFRKKLYDGIETMLADLDEGLYSYNRERTHQGKCVAAEHPSKP